MKRSLRVSSGILVGVLVFLVLACSTPYQELGRGGGYHDFKIDENRTYVYFGGNAYTTRTEAFRKARRRAAELAAQQSASFFKILDVERGASRYKAKLGSNPEPTYEKPIVTLVVSFHSSRPEGESVYRTDDVLAE